MSQPPCQLVQAVIAVSYPEGRPVLLEETPLECMFEYNEYPMMDDPSRFAENPVVVPSRRSKAGILCHSADHVTLFVLE